MPPLNDRQSETPGLSTSEQNEVHDKLRLRAAMVYEVVRREGDEELSRGLPALWWSGLAAGLSIGFSMVVQGLLKEGLGDQPGAHLIDSFGYCVGFLIVVLARQQLFTENTLTAVLPLMAETTWSNLGKVARLWLVVYLANMVGAFCFAAFVAFGNIFAPGTEQAFLAIGHHLFENSPSAMFLKGIAAGWLIAAMVWLLPAAGHAAFLVITLMTYIIALAGLTHIIAGSVEAFYLLFRGEASLMGTLFGFMAPTLAGNVIGGSALFALISYAQVKDEI